MARRHSAFVRTGSKTRRDTAWFGITDASTTLGAGISAVSGSFNAAALAMRPFTIIRVRGWMFLRSDQVAASEAYGVSVGFAVVSDQASAIGVTAVPTPITDKSSDLFFLYESLFGRIEAQSAVGVQEIGRFAKVDSKAMRKVNDDQDMVIVAENSGLSSDTVILADGYRMLVKLH